MLAKATCSSHSSRPHLHGHQLALLVDPAPLQLLALLALGRDLLGQAGNGGLQRARLNRLCGEVNRQTGARQQVVML
jgi:hypothetical protein